MKINDIIGKAWLSSLDDSDGYVVSFKLIGQNSSSPVSPEKEQEEKNPVKELKSTEKQKLTYDSKQKQLCKYLKHHFLKEQATFRLFVEKVNSETAYLNIYISGITYEELKLPNKDKEGNNLISGKSEDLTRKFGNENQLALLENIFENFKKST